MTTPTAPSPAQDGLAVVPVPSTPGVERGCGRREEGGLYAECGLGLGGSPLEAFLVDPPIPFEPACKVGVELIRRDGPPGPDGKPTDVYHVVDWVGSSHYPSPADVIEEGREHGFSRRLPPSLDVSLLSAQSRLLLCHERARLVNGAELAAFAEAGQYPPEHPNGASKLHGWCPAKLRGELDHAHAEGEPCLGYAWLVHPDQNRVGTHGAQSGQTLFSVARPLPPGAPEPVYEAGIFASLPITALTVIEARDGSDVELRASATAAASSRSDGRGIPVVSQPA